MLPFSRFRERRRRERATYDLYRAVVEAARRPAFYTGLGVPDSVDGRFDLLVLHAFAVIRRLGSLGTPAAAALSQAVFDLMFADMDANLRELGVSDLAVGNKVKAMAKAFYGRVDAYEKALGEKAQDGADAALEAALARNLYGTVQAAPAHLAAMAGYTRRMVAGLDGQDPSDGKVEFPDAP